MTETKQHPIAEEKLLPSSEDAELLGLAPLLIPAEEAELLGLAPLQLFEVPGQEPKAALAERE